MAVSVRIRERAAVPPLAAEATVLVALTPASYVARLNAALHLSAPIHRLESWTQLCHAAELFPDAVAVVDPLAYEGKGSDLDRALAPFAEKASLIVYTRVTPAAMRRLIQLPAVSSAQLVLFGLDDSPAQLREAFRAASHSACRRRALHSLRTMVDPLPRDIGQSLERLFLAGGDQLTVPGLAHCAQLSVRTLQRRLAAAHRPSPLWLMRMARAVLARELLSSTNLTVAEVARRVGYAKRRSLRTLLRRSFGSSPSMLRAGGS